MNVNIENSCQNILSNLLLSLALSTAAFNLEEGVSTFKNKTQFFFFNSRLTLFLVTSQYFKIKF